METNSRKWSEVVVAVLMGGPSSERLVSMATGEAVAEALEATGAKAVHRVVVDDENFVLPQGVGLAFICLHGTFGEDGQVQEELARRGVPYTGAAAAASRVAFDKLASKRVFVKQGVPTPKFEVFGADELPQLSPLPLPVVVKPTREGSSVGVHIVREQAQWSEAVKEAASHGSPVLVEEFVQGRELTVGILGGVALPIIEIVPRSGFYDMANKYPWLKQSAAEELDEDGEKDAVVDASEAQQADGAESEDRDQALGSDYVCPAQLDEDLEVLVQDVALRAHAALEVGVYSRADVLLDEQDRAWVLEVNTIPGMTETSLLPQAAAAVGIGFEQLCLRIASLSLKSS